MQTDNRILEDLARVAGSAMGTASGVKDEIEAVLKRHLEKILLSMDLVTRDEFEAVKNIATKARSEQERLNQRLDKLEKNFKQREALPIKNILLNN